MPAPLPGPAEYRGEVVDLMHLHTLTQTTGNISDLGSDLCTLARRDAEGALHMSPLKEDNFFDNLVNLNAPNNTSTAREYLRELRDAPDIETYVILSKDDRMVTGLAQRFPETQVTIQTLEGVFVIQGLQRIWISRETMGGLFVPAMSDTIHGLAQLTLAYAQGFEPDPAIQDGAFALEEVPGPSVNADIDSAYKQAEFLGLPVAAAAFGTSLTPTIRLENRHLYFRQPPAHLAEGPPAP